MRKTITAILVALTLALPLAPVVEVAEASNYRITIATATTGGAYYPIGSAMANIWSRNLRAVRRATAQITAGTPENVDLMKKGDVQIALGQNGVCYYAYKGEGSYSETEPYSDIRGMFTLYPNVMHWVVRKGSGVKSIADLKDKKFVPGQVNSATEINSREIMEVYGLNYHSEVGPTNVNAELVGYNEATDLINNDQIDGMHVIGGIPTSAVKDALASGVTELISIDPDKIKEIAEKYPWYLPFTIPANTYPNQPQEIKTLALANILFTDAKQDEELIYMLTKATYDHHADLVAAHSATAYTVIENALQGMTIPLHPGAVRYLKEMNVEIPANLIAD